MLNDIVSMLNNPAELNAHNLNFSLFSAHFVSSAADAGIRRRP